MAIMLLKPLKHINEACLSGEASAQPEPDKNRHHPVKQRTSRFQT